MMKKFSVLVAHYNNYDYFKDCYQSLLNQTCQDFEIIIVDDCSTDDSYGKIQELIQKDHRIKLFKNEQNRGVGFTKNRCIELSTGDICGFLDPDDALTEKAIELSLKHHNEDNVVTYSKFYLCDSSLKPIKLFPHSRAVNNGNQTFFNVFLEANHFFTFKKEAYNKTMGINPQLTSAVDQDLYLKLYETGNFIFIKEPLYLYRLHDKGVSQEKSKKEKLNQNWQNVLLETAKRRNVTQLYGKNIDEIENLQDFIFKKQNNFFTKLKRKLQ